MSMLFLVRHSQASFAADDYDALSSTGHEQSKALGRHWLARGLIFDRVWVGPLRRQRETADGVAAIYGEANAPWPVPERLDALSEHDGPRVLDSSGTYRREAAPGLSPRTAESERRRYFAAYQQVSRAWARGEHPTPDGLESWADFRRRIATGVEQIVDSAGRGEKVAAFTSGGVVAAVLGHALGLDDEEVVTLSWRVKNATVSTFVFSSGRFSLDSFNTAEHLPTVYHTYI
ncbi:MAG: histidine phosphatase family protein [Acidobacteriota bacterium]